MSASTKTKHAIGGFTVLEWPGAKPPRGRQLTVFGLPGLGSPGGMWSYLTEAVPEARIFSWDMRGRGDGVGLGGPTGLRQHAKDVAAILEELDLTDVVLVGHSMGAFLAPLVVQEAPTRIARVVMLDGGIRPDLPGIMRPWMARIAFTRELTRLDKDWKSFDDLLKAAKFDRSIKGRPDLKAKVEAILTDDFEETGRIRPRTDNARCAADAVDTFFGAETTPAFEALKVPTTALLASNKKWDGQVPFISDKQAERFAAKVDSLTWKRLPGNHITLVFDPAIADAVRGL
jgi:pimeloyl-ACP methyl ester carboxylesterase